MDDAEALVAIIALGCSTGLVAWFIMCVKDVLLHRSSKVPDATITELRALREEIRQLRQENHDLILSFDTTLQQVDRRLEHVESQRSLGGVLTASREAEPELSVRQRAGM